MSILFSPKNSVHTYFYSAFVVDVVICKENGTATNEYFPFFNSFQIIAGRQACSALNAIVDWQLAFWYFDLVPSLSHLRSFPFRVKSVDAWASVIIIMFQIVFGIIYVASAVQHSRAHNDIRILCCCRCRFFFHLCFIRNLLHIRTRCEYITCAHTRTLSRKTMNTIKMTTTDDGRNEPLFSMLNWQQTFIRFIRT